MLIVFCRNIDAASFLSAQFATLKYQMPLAFWFYKSIGVHSNLQHLLTFTMALWCLSQEIFKYIFFSPTEFQADTLENRAEFSLDKDLLMVFCIMKPCLKGVFSCSHSPGQARSHGEEGNRDLLLRLKLKVLT